MPQLESLFCWKGRCNQQDRRRQPLHIRVGILVLLEESLQQGDRDVSPGERALESLFCWKSRCNKEIGMSRPGNERWNPCSVGRVVATAGYFDQYHHLSVGILVLLEGSLQPYPVRAGITLAPPHHFRFSGASPRTSSAHPNSLPASVMKISFGTSPGAGRGLAGPPSPVSGINPCSFQSGYFSIAHSPKQLADRSSTAGPPPTARGCGTALQGSGR